MNMLKSSIRRFYFPVLSVIAVLVYIAQQQDRAIPELINNYLNDFLCMPIVLKVCQYVVRHVRSDKQVCIPIIIQVTITLFFAIYFEGILPVLGERYTADFYDLIAYSLGLFLFMFIESQGKLKTLNSS